MLKKSIQNENIKEAVKEQQKEKVIVTERMKKRVNQYLLSNAGKAISMHVREHIRLTITNYPVLKDFIAWLKTGFTDDEIDVFIFDCVLEQFLVEDHGFSDSLVQHIKHSLSHFYTACQQMPDRRLIRQVQLHSANNQLNISLARLSEQKTIDEKLSLLNQYYNHRIGWYALSKSLIQDRAWIQFQEFLEVLINLPKGIVEANLHAKHCHRQCVIDLITQTVPAGLIFKLLDGFDIEDKHIIRLGRIPGLKEAVKYHIEQLQLGLSTKQELWKKCVSAETSLGKFFRTTRTSLGFSKFYNDFASTKIVEDIASKIRQLEPKVKSTSATLAILLHDRSEEVKPSKHQHAFFTSTCEVTQPAELDEPELKNTDLMWFSTVSRIDDMPIIMGADPFTLEHR